MDWEALAVDGLIGALAGAIGWLATRKLAQTNKSRASLIRVFIVVLPLSVGTQVVTPLLKERRERNEMYEAGLSLYGHPGAAATFAQTMEPLLRDPKLQARLRTQPQGDDGGSTGRRALFAELTAGGLGRLSPEELDAFFEAKRALAEASPALCAGFWTGNLAAANLMAGVRQLPEAEQRKWITATVRAASLELQAGSPAPHIAGAAADRAMADLVATLSPDEARGYAKATEDGANGEAAQCTAFLTIAQGLKRVPPATRQTVIRMISVPDLVDR